MQRFRLFFKLTLTTLAFVSFVFPTTALAIDDPTRGKPFFPWLWEDQFKPTFEQVPNTGNLGILGAGVVTSIVAHQYEQEVVEHNARGQNLIMTQDTAGVLGTIGGGGLGIGIAVVQILFDQENGLMHGRAIALTSLSHVTLSYLFRKSRPAGRGDYLPFPSSFPSGHAASAFATASSLAYSYGYVAGVPAYLVATAIAAARVSENAHWLSDVFAGAALGVFWARASFQARDDGDVSWLPMPYEDGAIIQATLNF